MAEKSLKGALVDYLLENNLVEEYDVVRHSYSTSRMSRFYTNNSTNHNISPTLDTRCDCLGVVLKENGRLRIRKFTPKECFRIMGFDDSDWGAASQHSSDMNLYRQAGNSIAINCLETIFGSLLGIETDSELEQTDDSNRLF